MSSALEKHLDPNPVALDLREILGANEIAQFEKAALLAGSVDLKEHFLNFCLSGIRQEALAALHRRGSPSPQSLQH